MADLYQSSLLEPTAPPEHLLHQPVTKKPIKVVSGKESKAEENTPITNNTPSSRPAHSFNTFLNYFTKRRKANNNNDTINNNNSSKLNHEHSSKATETRGNGSPSKAESGGGKRFAFFRGRHTLEPSIQSSTEATPTSETEEQEPPSQIPQVDGKQPESLQPQSRDEEVEVLCHGLMSQTDSIGEKCLLSHPGNETEMDLELEVVEQNSNMTQSNENEKLGDVSTMQEQLNSVNLMRCMEATMPESIGSTTTLPAHSESLSIPPVIEEMDEGSVEEQPVIEVLLPHREPPLKQSSGGDVMQALDHNLDGTQNNVKKRRKLRHILRHFLNMKGSFVKEDKRRLVEEEEEDEEEEEEHGMVETAIDEDDGQRDNKTCSISKTPSSPHDSVTADPDNTRLPGTKGRGRGWGRRVRRSLGRGCHYLGLSVFNISNYIIAEATFMGPVYPHRNYDWDYIYCTNEYGINDYKMYYE